MTTKAEGPGRIRSIDGGALRYRVAGRGPLLVCHPPGWGIGAAPYAATLTPLEAHFTVIYLWPRGAAGSPAIPAGARLDVATFVADLERLRVHLGVDHFALAGHSHGGFVALHYALRHPDRVNRLLLMSAQLTGIPSDYAEPSVSRDEPVPAEIADALRYLASVGGLDALFRLNSDAEATEFLARILPLYFRDPRTMSPLLAALNGLSLPCRVLQAVTASDEQYPLSLQEVGALEMPTVLTSGRHDRFVAMGHVQTVARAMRGSTHLVFDESGHFPWLEEPELFFDRSIGALRAERT